MIKTVFPLMVLRMYAALVIQAKAESKRSLVHCSCRCCILSFPPLVVSFIAQGKRNCRHMLQALPVVTRGPFYEPRLLTAWQAWEETPFANFYTSPEELSVNFSVDSRRHSLPNYQRHVYHSARHLIEQIVTASCGPECLCQAAFPLCS